MRGYIYIYIYIYIYTPVVIINIYVTFVLLLLPFCYNIILSQSFESGCIFKMIVRLDKKHLLLYEVSFFKYFNAHHPLLHALRTIKHDFKKWGQKRFG